MKKSDSSGKQKPTALNPCTCAKRKKSLSEEEMEDLCGELAMICASFSHVMQSLHEISTQRGGNFLRGK